MFDKIKDLYQMRKQAKEIKGKLKKTHIEAEVEGVIATITGEQEVVEMQISDEAMADKKRLERNIVTCLNKAIKKSQEIGAQMMRSVMGDSGFPGMG